MCLGVPGTVVSIEGDYVLVHVGFVIERLEKEDAEETLRLFEELERGSLGSIEEDKR
jgi:hydrogenase maturation factor